MLDRGQVHDNFLSTGGICTCPEPVTGGVIFFCLN
jgi:hypothetical protein